MIDNRYKIFGGDAGNSYELYDLIADPGETLDLASQRPDVVRRMKAVLDQWVESCHSDAVRGWHATVGDKSADFRRHVRAEGPDGKTA